MTTEQREAIDRLKDDIKYADMRDTVDDDCTICFIDDLDTVLSLIKEQQEKIENTTTNYKNLIADVSSIAKELELEEDATIDEIYTAIRILKSKRINVIEQLDCIEKKDKQIDKMIDNIMTHYQVKTIRKMCCSTCKIGERACTYSGIHRNCIKQYFAGLVEKE